MPAAGLTKAIVYTLGIDYGTNSVRALIVRCADGAEIGCHVSNYSSGREGIQLDPKNHHLARQHPGDYLASLEASVLGALRAAKKSKGFSPQKIVGIGVDTTGSSPIPVDARNVPLDTLDDGTMIDTSFPGFVELMRGLGARLERAS